MKTLLFLVCLTTAICGCRLPSSDKANSSNFRLEVEDVAMNDSLIFANLKISTVQPTLLAIGAGNRFTIPAANKCRRRTVEFSANRDLAPTNAEPYRAIFIDVVKEDIKAPGFNRHECGLTMPASKEDKLSAFASMTAKTGFYPLDKPLEIGKLDGRAVTLTVTAEAK
jgi:hypothetical protein